MSPINWTDEHPDANVPARIATHPELEDISWHNDVCPSFVRLSDGDPDADTLRLWVDYEDPTARETGPETPRYRVMTGNGDDPLYEGEDADRALAVLFAAPRREHDDAD